MPIYEYRSPENGCSKCSQRFEVFQKMSDSSITACPDCGGPVQRVISAHSGTVKDSMGDSNLSRLGFSKYKKNSDGFYEKKFGGGPSPKIPAV